MSKQINFNALPPALRKRVDDAMSQCLTSEVLDQIIDKGLLMDYLSGAENAVEAEKAIRAEIIENGGTAIWEKCPPLLTLIESIVKNYCAAADELRARFAKEDLGEIIDISADMSDCHNFGRTTCVVTTTKGKYVYKPRDMRIDAIIGEFFDKFFPDTVRLPRVIVREGYGFAAFIENCPAATMDEARAYYRRMGGFAVALKILNNAYMPCENMFAQGGYPVPIDLETIITPAFEENTDETRLINLMPVRADSKEISLMFSPSECNISVPRVDGRAILLPDCLDDFLSGFEEAYTRCLNRKDEIERYVRAMPSVFVRLMLRGTNAYYNLYQKTCSRAWLNDKNLRGCVYGALSKTGKSMPDAILNSETDALLRGDIPYFRAEADSTRVMGADGVIAVSCAQNMLDALNRLSESDKRFHMTVFTRACVSEPCRSATRDYIDRAEALFDKLIKEAIISPSGRLCWLENGIRASVLTDDGFMDGNAGIALFAAAIAKMTRRRDAAEMRDRLLEQILSDLPQIKAYDWSTGLAGIAHAALMMPESPFSEKIIEKIIAILPEIDLDGLDNDFIAGLAGLLTVVCEMNDPRLEAFKQRLAQKLIGRKKRLWKTLRTNIISGLGHGQIGIGHALERAGFAKDARCAFDFEHDVYSEELQGWPDFRESAQPVNVMHGYCSGAPGIGLVALRRGDAGELERAIQCCLKYSQLKRNHLCCGNSAAIDFLLECGVKLNRPELIRAAREKMDEIENVDMDKMFDLFFGISGIGHTLLRCADPVAVRSPIL